MSIESVLTEIAALRSEVKSLSKICRKIKSKQDDPTGEKAASRAKNNGFNREQAVSEKLRKFLGLKEGQIVSILEELMENCDGADSVIELCVA